MQKIPARLRAFAGLFSVAAVMVAVPLAGAWAVDAAKDPQMRAQHRQERVLARLAIDANRLQIKASQQAAWQAYVDARKAFATGAFAPQPDNVDAATMAKFRADRAAEFAQKLSTLADATAKLQVVLSPDQRTTLDQITQRGHHRHGQGGWLRGQGPSRGEGREHAWESPVQQGEAVLS